MTSWRSAVRVSYIPLNIDHSYLGEILAASVLSLIPSLQLCSVEGDAPLFAAEFSEEVPKEMLPHIEELMHRKLKEEPRFIEMMPKVAKRYLRDRGMVFRSKEIEGGEGLISLIELPGYVNAYEGEMEAEGGPFRILEIDETVIRAVALPEKKDLKEYAKHYQTRKESVTEGHFSDEVWYPKGWKMRNRLAEKWRLVAEDAGFEVASGDVGGKVVVELTDFLMGPESVSKRFLKECGLEMEMQDRLERRRTLGDEQGIDLREVVTLLLEINPVPL